MISFSSSQKLRIGVLMGGKSIEREVSFNSGRTVCDHLDSSKYSVIPLFQAENGVLYILPWYFLHRGKIADFRQRLDSEGTRISWDELKKQVDFVYITLHGRYGEDGTVQGMLEVLGIPYLGSKVFGSALGMDKIIQKDFLKAQGVDVARGIVLHPWELTNLTEAEVIARLEAAGVALPYIVKPTHEGSSLGINVIFEYKELMPAIVQAMHADEYKVQSILIEEKLSGMEFVCVALQKTYQENGANKDEWFTLPITEVVIEANSHFFTYEQKYMPGRAEKITPARCSEQDRQRIAQICIQATKILNFSIISRIDGFLTSDGRVVLIDPNSLTGMAPATFLFHQAAEFGMSHTQLINFLIESELQQYGFGTISRTQDLTKEGAMPQTAKIKVAVLLGGESNEREISLESGRNVCYKLSPQKYTIIPLFVNENMELFQLDQRLLIKNSTREISAGVTPDLAREWSDLPSLCDFVFLGLHGGKGESGAVQGALEMLGLPYNGSGVLASALCMDKFKTNNFLRSNGFDVPWSYLVNKEQWSQLTNDERLAFLTLALKPVKFPVVVKPHDDGCSFMVSKASTIEEVAQCLNTTFATKTDVMIEEFVQGLELTVGVLGNDNPRALPASLAVAKGGILSIEEKFLPGAGENQTPAPIEPTAMALVQQVIQNAFVAVGCKGYARIDCFYQEADQSPTGKERVVILEFNTLPGLTRLYSGLWYKRMILGLWVLAEGVIYDMWDESKHVVHEVPKLDHEWITIDYGTGNPTAFLHQGFNNKLQKYFTAREYYYSSRETGVQKTDAEYSKDLQSFTAGKRFTVIVDPSAASFIAQLRKDGFMVIEAENSVLDGIRWVATLLQNEQYAVHDSCRNTIEENATYVWDEKAQELGIDKPVKQKDHAKDAERYGLYTNRWLIDRADSKYNKLRKAGKTRKAGGM